MSTETGISRRMDRLGRIVVPAEMRQSLGIAKDEMLQISVEGSSIVLTKPVSVCTLCSGKSDLFVFRGKEVCGNCLRALARLRHDGSVSSRKTAE